MGIPPLITALVAFILLLGGNSGYAARDGRLEMHLHAWERAAKQIKDFRCTWERRRIDSVFRTVDIDQVSVMGTGMGLVRFEQRDARRELRGVVLITATKLHAYDYKNRFELVLDWPAPIRAKVGWLSLWPEMSSDLTDLISVLAGLPPPDMRRRYEISLQGEDSYHVYLRWRLLPKDRQIWGQVALEKKTYRVRLLGMDSPNGDQTLYTLKQQQTNLSPPLSPESITADLPKGWKSFDPGGDHN
jgi:hypothetical protein